ncbi:dipicolinate synthase subunit B [Colidextribacter sp. OB.20]|uniref:dipicolinate synthase subunit B n=1 Tax=Colidextribacter sp. OB.20 TaxID=2304568 RepID=UPI00136B9C01|nr:dipicolinate synthase subunit B [Colidextribacter sp. OB.20]NBI08868.1 dipicolinate synthase subunit B [Colidextribacter sp. OB.20]
MKNNTVGFAVCGSFCTHARAMEALEQVKARFARVVPIVSEVVTSTDTRFGRAHDLMREMERICDCRVISTVQGAEPIGPQKLLDLLIICPCTGNTLGKLAAGITDTSVTMAAKAHLRNERPLLIAPSTNDGLAASAAGIGALLARKHIYFVPFGQDDFEKKPTSLVSDFSQVADAAQAALEGRQLQPILLRT